MIWQDVVCPARELISMNMISVLKEFEVFFVVAELVSSSYDLLSFFLLAVIASAISQSNHFFFPLAVGLQVGTPSPSCGSIT